jgi:hypothetical protein
MRRSLPLFAGLASLAMAISTWCWHFPIMGTDPAVVHHMSAVAAYSVSANPLDGRVEADQHPAAPTDDHGVAPDRVTTDGDLTDRCSLPPQQVTPAGFPQVVDVPASAPRPICGQRAPPGSRPTP